MDWETMSKRTVYICDVCNNDMGVADVYRSKAVINAGVFGVHMHTSCFKALLPLQLVKLLRLDEITIGGEKLAYIDEKWFNRESG